MKITKKDFIEAIENIEKQYNHDTKCSKAFQTILPDVYVSLYDNTHITNQAIKLLELLCDDKDKLIEYYLYELDFGKEFKIGCITHNNIDLDVSCPSKLYDTLELESKIISDNETIQRKSYSEYLMKKCWSASSDYTDQVNRIGNRNSNFDNPTYPNFEEFIKSI